MAVTTDELPEEQPLLLLQSQQAGHLVNDKADVVVLMPRESKADGNCSTLKQQHRRGPAPFEKVRQCHRGVCVWDRACVPPHNMMAHFDSHVGSIGAAVEADDMRFPFVHTGLCVWGAQADAERSWAAPFELSAQVEVVAAFQSDCCWAQVLQNIGMESSMFSMKLASKC
jgi:hypothetical protein